MTTTTEAVSGDISDVAAGRAQLDAIDEQIRSLVLHSTGSTDDLAGMAAAVASALPDGRSRSLPGGWHGVDDAVVAPVLREFFLT